MLKAEEISLSQIKPQQSDASGSIVEQMNRISISEVPVEVDSFTDSAEVPKDRSSGPDLDKRIRALKKKVLSIVYFPVLICMLLFCSLYADFFIQLNF